MMSRIDDERYSFLAFARNHVFVTLFGIVAPVLLFACFIGYPIVYTIYLSFFEWNGMAPTKTFIDETCSMPSLREISPSGNLRFSCLHKRKRTRSRSTIWTRQS